MSRSPSRSFDRCDPFMDNPRVLRFRRHVAIVIAIAWFLPSLAAGAVAVHLALEHHGHATSDQSHHAPHEAAPEHEHEVAIGPDHGHRIALLKTGSLGARSLTARPASLPAADAHLPGPEPPITAGRFAPPPGPLFLSHCSLLI